MRTITDIRKWKNETEVRIYFSFDNKEEACYYLTGNKYNEKGKLQNMTIEEKAQALQLIEEHKGIKNAWVSLRYYEIKPQTSRFASNNNSSSYKSYDEEDLDRAEYMRNTRNF